MRYAATFRILGILLMIFSLSMLPPLAISLWFRDGGIWAFSVGFLVTFSAGLMIWLPLRQQQYDLKTRDGFLVVTLFWTVLSVFGSIPFMINLFPQMDFTDAMFETVSGLTTTGATVLHHISLISHSVLYYRQQLHLLGGMGIIVLAIAILPMLGVGGMQLYRAETVGPIKTTKLKPRMAQSAKALWAIYVGLVIVCALCYWLAGMKPFDAIGESFSTLSTGGFSTHDSSFAFYHSNVINVIGIVFMLLGATNFGLHFQFLKRGRISLYYKDPEFRNYLLLLGIVSLIILLALLSLRPGHHANTLVNVLFTVVSVSTTTGLTTTNFNLWPTFVPFLLMFVAMLGGCGGSTSGGIKIMRCLLLKEQGKRELKRLVHPKAEISIKLGGQELSDSVAQAIWGFVSVFIVLFVVLFLVLLATGLDVRTAFGALASCISNTGAAIGSVASNFEHIPKLSKWVCIFAMIAGRLEIFTLLVLFTPTYWRK